MQQQSTADHAPSGLATLPPLAWGSHLGQLYNSAGDLRDTLVPYFRAGLDNNERCLWVTDAPFDVNDARDALRAAIPDFDRRERLGQIEIQNTQAFYDARQPLDPTALVAGLLQREGEALAAGYRGLRTNGNCSLIAQGRWTSFLDYESRVQQSVSGRRLICMCSYCHDRMEPATLGMIFERHDLVVHRPRSNGHAPPGPHDVPSPISEFHEDVAAIQTISAVPTILEVVCNTTGMGFAAIARVTPERWVCLASHDEIGFGLKPGGELQVDTTLCHEVRQARGVVAIDHVAEDAVYRLHRTPALYGFQSYISMPIFMQDGQFYGTLCAIDPKPAKLNNPTVVGMFRMFADLIALHLEAGTRLAHAEASLADARAVNDLHDQFIAVLGHDLRNPIAGIAAGATLLRKTKLDDRALMITDAIEKSASRMAVLVDNIMDMTRGRLGKGIALSTTRKGLEPALRHAVEELRLAHPGRAIEVAIELGHPVEADPDKMARLLSNLLKNALLYGADSAPVRVSVATDDNNFVLSVSNKGEPIPPETQKRLFAPFTRGAAQDQQGLGLGLYIVAEIARAHGGTIDLDSTAEETRFTVRIPVAASDPLSKQAATSGVVTPSRPGQSRVPPQLPPLIIR
jgi:signal transduction histidine kinase